MWVVVLGSKGEAADVIRRAQAVAKAECGRKLRVLRTDNGGKFTAAEFTSYCARVFSATTPCNTHFLQELNFCPHRSAYNNAYQMVVHMKNFPKINLV
jgi:hypothetical protein